MLYMPFFARTPNSAGTWVGFTCRHPVNYLILLPADHDLLSMILISLTNAATVLVSITGRGAFMKWSVKIGRFVGIDVYMHLTFLLLIGWVALMHWQNGRSVSAALVGVLFILAIFLCVTLHEFGHALMARRYGISTRDITLLPIGGVARLERMPTQPIQELRVALAGPAVNAVIAVALFIWVKLTASWEPLQSLSVTTGPFLERLMVVNLFMIVFNMIPAFPMDGGRVLRAVLATRQEYDRATRIAASIGRGTALVFGVAGFFYNPILVFIALFVWMGATQEAGMVQLESEISTIPVHKAMVSDFKTLSIQDSLNRAVELSLAGTQKDFPVVSDGVLEGMLRQTDLVKALPERDAQSSVLSITNKDMLTVDITEMLDAVVAKFNACECHTLPVVQDGELVGLVTSDNLDALVRIRAAATH
jgi:Zn-dependent protease